MTSIQIILVIGIFSMIVMGAIVYKALKQPKYRVVETQIGGSYWYHPQVKIEWVWLNIARKHYDYDRQCSEYYLATATDNRLEFLSPDDCVKHIEEFKRAGNFTIPSNEPLKNNQKYIPVE